MKKILIASLFVLIPSVSYASFDQSLSYGMANQSVMELQDFLTEQGCFKVQPTGFFGAITLSSVKCFQAKYGIIQTGYFGVLSRTQANSLLAEMLQPLVNAAIDEASTAPAAPSVTTAPAPAPAPTQYIFIPSQEPVTTQKAMPQITISGKLPALILSDIPSGVTMSGFTFNFTSTDFTPQQLAAITSSFVYSRQSAGSTGHVTSWNQYDISFGNVPTTNLSGKIKIQVSGLNATGADVAGLPVEAAYIVDIKIFKDSQGLDKVGYTLSPDWLVEGRPNPNP